MKRKICIVHFQPLERYPPAFNLLRTIAAQQPANKPVFVITTSPESSKQKIEVPGITIYRIAVLPAGISRLNRMVLYLLFNLKAFFILLVKRPASVLYFETLSAGAACLYKMLSGTRLLIHYHEYTSPDEYRGGMVLNKWLHHLELQQYKKAVWVSHTNEERMQLFLSDCGALAPSNTFILPNYPPTAWAHQAGHTIAAGAVTGFVYVGALDTDTMYLKEMASFVANNASICYWDIYSDNHSAAAVEYLENLNAGNIHFKGAAVYDQLPAIISGYHVGLILYKGHIPNYTFNAPNKLFEYAVCGLDVWFPNHMVSSRRYITQDSYPSVTAVDFETLETSFILQSAKKAGRPYQPHPYSCENALAPLLQVLYNDVL
jgi:hypothetical protein